MECIYDNVTAQAFGLREGQLVISIHCGSRGLDHQIGTDYPVMLAKATGRLGIRLPDRELTCAPIKSPEERQYLGAMNAAINCALANRQILTHLTRDTFAEAYPQASLETIRYLAQHLQGRTARSGRQNPLTACASPQSRFSAPQSMQQRITVTGNI